MGFRMTETESLMSKVQSTRCTPSEISNSGTLEQDEVIDDIRHQMTKSGREHEIGVGMITLLSCVL